MIRVQTLAAIVALVAAMPANPGMADQLDREVVRTHDGVRFTIAFRDSRDRTHRVTFAVPARSFAEGKDGLPPVDSEAVRERINKPVEAYVAKRRARWREAMRRRLDRIRRGLPEHITIEHSFDGGDLSWSLKSREARRDELRAIADRIKDQIEAVSERILDRARDEVERYAAKVRDDVYNQLYYVRDPQLDLLRVDYRRVAKEAAQRLRPLARAIAAQAGQSARQRLTLALALLQTIPYDRLTDRDVADGTGFATPIEMLHLNRGDCDSKATALAALMRTLAPEVRTAMILLPGHAVLAAEIPTEPGDRVIELRDDKFVLMEPAGPARTPVGEIADSSLESFKDDGAQSIVWLTG
jgi:transglutaminase-like putative cysteine protease